jgi:putative two-component system response regulator
MLETEGGSTMDTDSEATRQDPKLPWDYAEWRLLHGAMLRLEAAEHPTPCVLIIDDDPATRLLYAVNLELEGLRVIEASDGSAGLDRAREEHPDLILTDVMMPGIDGFALAEALRGDERTSRIPFIFLSGEVTEGRQARAHEYGALAFLAKPVDVRALAALVAGVFASRRASARPMLPRDEGAQPMSDSAA